MSRIKFSVILIGFLMVLLGAAGAQAGTGSAVSNIITVDTTAQAGTGSAASNILTVDTTDPTGTATINGGAAYTTNPAVTLTLSASDAGGVAEMKFSNDNATWSAVETYGTTKAWTLSGGDGSKTVYVKYKDTVGNWSGVVTATIALDTRAPVTTANPPAGTYNAAQNVTLSADKTATIYYTTDGTVPTTASAVSSAPIAVNTSKTIKFFARDEAGNMEAVKEAAYVIDTAGPTGGTIAIDGGAARTKSATVTLALSATDSGSGISQMQFSNDGTTWSAAETCSATKSSWTLSAGDGQKTVYVLFKDNAGNWSTPVSATIVLDTAAPVTTAAPKGGEYSAMTKVTLSANESATIYYTTNGDDPTTTSTTYAVFPIPIAQTTTLKFFAKDTTGNVEAIKMETYTITTDASGPTGTVKINDEAVYTNNPNVTLTLSASDLSGVPEMQFSQDNAAWSTPESYNAANPTKSLTLTGGDGVKAVYVKYKDGLGNWSAPYSATITLDTVPPVTTANPRGGSFKSAQNVTLTASQTATIYYTTNNSDPTTTSPVYGAPISITVDATLKFFAKDPAGNAEAIKTERYVIDALPPTGGTISVNGGAATATSQNVTLTLNAADPSGVAQMQFSNDGINWSDPEPYSATKSWSLSAGNGAKTVYVRYADALGNWTTATIAATIDLQVAARPQDPKGLAIESVTASSAALQWNRNTEANVVYHIFRSRTADGIFYRVNTAPVDDRNYDYASGKMRFTDRVVKEGGTYYYRIQAVLNGVASAGFSDIMGATLPTIDDYTVNIIEPSTIAAVGGTAKYIVQLLPRERFQGTLNLTCMKVPSGLTYAFVLNNRRTASLAEVALPATVTLEVTAGSIALAKEHHFDLLVQNVWESGSSDPRTIPLTLTVVANNGAGIFADLDRTEFGKGEKVRIYGAIWPPPLAERTVTLTITPASGGIPQLRTVKTSASGKFSETEWTFTLGVGTYDLEASWQDENANRWTSEARTFVASRGEAVVTCLRDANVKPKQGDDFTISGKLAPAGVAALTYRVVDPDGRMKDYAFFTAEDGAYRQTGNFFTKKGVWKFKVYWTGNDDWIGTESEWLSVPVEVELGRAIILGGGVAEQSNTYWEVTKKLIVDAYRDFKSRGFTDDMIHLMINGQVDINYDSKIDDVVDNGQPSVTAFLDAIRSRYAAAQNPELNAEVPLYIYMQGHGTNDARFKVLGDDQYVNAAQIKGALDTLQQQTGCTVVLIIEACYSGTFIQGLTPPEGYKRIILTSADNKPYSTDASGRNAFSRYLFSKLREGDNFYKAFTYTRNILQNMGYPPPRLEDFSGGVLATAMLLKGDLTWGLRPVIAAIEATSVLEQATTTPIAVNVTRGDVDVEKVWLQVIAPNAQIIGQEGTIAYPEVTLVKNAATGKYIGTLNGLSISGTYKIVVFAQDVDKEVSDPATAFITVASPPMPGDVNGDGYVTLADAILTMQLTVGMAPPAGAIQEGYAPSIGDVNNDKKIGLAEAIFILQKSAGIR